MRSMFSADGKQWIFGDAFGLTRLDLTKAPKLSKHSTKVFNPNGVMSLTSDGKLAMMNGRVQTGAYGSPKAVCVGLPGLGIKAEDTRSIAPLGVFGPSTDARALRFGTNDALAVLRIKDDELVDERAVRFEGAPKLSELTVGPQVELGPKHHSQRRLLRVMPDGRFLALGSDGQLTAGQASLTPGHDELWWTLPLLIHPTVAARLEMVGETAYAVVMDHDADVARIVEVSRTGSAHVYELPAISPPAVTERHIVSQVSSDTIWRRDLISGHDEVFDVGAYNPHPAPAIDPALFHGEPPGAPTRLPGHVDARGDRVLFVPWHGEAILVVTDRQALDRGLSPGPSGFRRALLEHYARVNEGLRPLQLQSALAHLDQHPRYPSLPCGSWLPALPPTLESCFATVYTTKIINCMELKVGGYSWGSFGGEGGGGWVQERADEADVARLLRWMIGAGMVPNEADSVIERMYGDAMGIPHDPRPDGLRLTPGAERLLLRAFLEGIAGGGKWDVEELPESWAREPITAALANDRLGGLHNWRSYKPYNMLQALCMMLANYMGADALPVLVKLLEDHEEPFVYNHWRNCGELIVWICHAHPEHKDRSIAQISAIHKTHSSWVYEQDLTLKALARGAKHHWSNG